MKDTYAKILVVIVLLLYPLAHWVLHIRVHTDPWTLGGWAMYAVPRGRIAVQIHKEGVEHNANALCREETLNYVSQGLALGRLASGDELRRCLESKLEQPFDVIVLHRLFDGLTGRFIIVEHKLR